MKQWLLSNQWNLDGLSLIQAPIPEPGPGEVLLAMGAASLNYRDYLMVNHGYGSMSGELPLVPLSDGVGRVVALGQGVDGIETGQRLLPCFNQMWRGDIFKDYMWGGVLGGPLDGTARQYMCASAEATVRVPDHLTDEQASTLGCAAITAWNALRELPENGGIVLTQGTGGVSLMALQMAKARGARVIATSSSPEKLDRLSALGADQVIDYRQTPDWGKAALALTDGQGVDLVVDIGGAQTINQSLRATRNGGAVSLVGNVSGSVAEINLPHVFMFRKRMIGISTGSVADFKAMMAEIAVTGMVPVLDQRIYEFGGLATALEALPRAEHFGKITIKIEH